MAPIQARRRVAPKSRSAINRRYERRRPRTARVWTDRKLARVQVVTMVKWRELCGLADALGLVEPRDRLVRRAIGRERSELLRRARRMGHDVAALLAQAAARGRRRGGPARMPAPEIMRPPRPVRDRVNAGRTLR